MSETLIPAQGPVDVLVGWLRTHAEAHEYIANADPEQKQWMNAQRRGRNWKRAQVLREATPNAEITGG